MHTDVGSLNGGLGGTETQTDILVPAAGLADLAALRLGLRVLEDVRLLLVSALGLDGQLGRHGCGVFGSTRKRVSSWVEGIVSAKVEDEKDSLKAQTVVCAR